MALFLLLLWLLMSPLLTSIRIMDVEVNHHLIVVVGWARVRLQIEHLT